MSTPAQVLANRENSKLSTGPRTEEGKAVSSRNHLTHGLSSSDPVLPTENRDEFNALVESFVNEFQPATPHMKIMVVEMAEARWKLERIKRIETDAFARLDDPAKAYFDPETAAGFARLERYRASLERTYHRCLRALNTRPRDQRQIEAKFRQMQEQATLDLIRAVNEEPPRRHLPDQLCHRPAARHDAGHAAAQNTP